MWRETRFMVDYRVLFEGITVFFKSTGFCLGDYRVCFFSGGIIDFVWRNYSVFFRSTGFRLNGLSRGIIGFVWRNCRVF